jgi:hypothetical protein
MKFTLIFLFPLIFGIILSAKNKTKDLKQQQLGESVTFDWTKPIPVPSPLTLSVSVKGGLPAQDSDGFGVVGQGSHRVDPGEALAIRFQQDVVIDSVSLDTGSEGKAGGSFRMGNKFSKLIPAKNKDGVVRIKALGLLKRGEMLVLDPSAKSKKDQWGSWKLVGLTARAYPQVNSSPGPKSF